MSSKRRSILRTLRGLWLAFDWTLRVGVNLLLLAMLVVLFGLFSGGEPARVPEGAALVVSPSGYLVEALWGDPTERALREVLGQPLPPETSMPDLLEAIERARDDDRIRAMALDVEGLLGGGLSKLRDLKGAIESFREAGKTVVAYGDGYSQPQYYLASAADEILLHPMGLVLATGYGSYGRYYREALDRFAVEWNVFRVGEYKSAVEPYLRDDMSPEDRDARLAYLSDLWREWRADVGASRSLAPEQLDAYAARFPDKLAAVGGDAARLALEEGLVDRIAARDEARARLIELVGEDDAGESYRRIGWESYLTDVREPRRGGKKDVALIVASGTILDGTHPPGTVGGDSLARQIRRAREDVRVASVVLRIDSPGGSSFASEVIRREIEVTRREGKPVVASMGSVAASGGYWIAAAADQIWASPVTLTGSIGIFAMVPTFGGTLEKVGVHVDGVGTGPLAGTLRFDRPLPEAARAAIDLLVHQGYRDFITRVAEGRHMEAEAVDRVAGGRVWTGMDALGLGLVDSLGDLDEAIEAAAALADLGEEYGVREFVEAPTARARLLGLLLGAASRAGLRRPAVQAHPELAWLEVARRELAQWTELTGGTVAGLPRPWAHCLCDAGDRGPASAF